MIRRLRLSKKGQAPTAEYVILFAIVAAVAVSMTVYFRRAVQGRARDSGIYMYSELIRRTGPYANASDIPRQYEPYYINTVAVTDRNITDTEYLSGGGSTGIYQRVYNEFTRSDVVSNTAAPQDFNRTLTW